MQLRAPGSPVIIVGTHLDMMTDNIKVKQLEAEAEQRYSNTKLYPRVSVFYIHRNFHVSWLVSYRF